MDRFDDVGYDILESPEPGPRPRRRGVVALGAVIVAAGLGLGASALASDDEPAAPRTPAKSSELKARHHHGCRHGHGRHRDRGGDTESLGLRY